MKTSTLGLCVQVVESSELDALLDHAAMIGAAVTWGPRRDGSCYVKLHDIMSGDPEAYGVTIEDAAHGLMSAIRYGWTQVQHKARVL